MSAATVHSHGACTNTVVLYCSGFRAGGCIDEDHNYITTIHARHFSCFYAHYHLLGKEAFGVLIVGISSVSIVR